MHEVARLNPDLLSVLESGEPEISSRSVSVRASGAPRRTGGTRQRTVNGRMQPAKSAPNPMQQLARFPAVISRPRINLGN